jgi:hypothetical protein
LTPSPPLTEKENVFNHHARTSKDGIEKTAEQVHEDEDLDEKEGHSTFEQDPFVPFDDLPPEPHRVITFRAVFVGLCCGALVNASDVYLGLKTGWTFTANLFGVSSPVWILLIARLMQRIGYRRFRCDQVHVEAAHPNSGRRLRAS